MALTHRMIGVWVIMLLVAGVAWGQDFIEEDTPATPPEVEDGMVVVDDAPEDSFVTSPLTLPEGSDLEILWQLAGESEMDGTGFAVATGADGQLFLMGGQVTDMGLTLEARGLSNAGESLWAFPFEGEVSLPMWMGVDEDGLCTTLTFSMDPDAMIGGGTSPDLQVKRVVWDAAGGQVSDTTLTFAPPTSGGNDDRPMMSLLLVGAMSETGDVFVSGMSMVMDFNGPPTVKAMLGRLDASGQQVWETSLASSQSSEMNIAYTMIAAMEATPDNELFAVHVDQLFDEDVMWGGGLEEGEAIDWEGMMDTVSTIIKYSEAGQELWSVEMTLGEEDIVMPSDLVVDEDGRAIVAGMTTGDLAEVNAGGMDAFVAVYDEDGNWAWGHQMGRAGDDSFTKLLIDTDNACVYAFGASAPADEGSAQVVIVCYDLLGGYLWDKALDSSEWVSVQDAAIAADGSLHLLCTQVSGDNEYAFAAAVGGVMAMGANREGSGSVLLKLAPGWDAAP